MKSLITVAVLTFATSITAFAQETKTDNTCRGINAMKCASGAALVTGGMTHRVLSIEESELVRLTESPGVVARASNTEELNRLLRSSTRDESFLIEFRESPATEARKAVQKYTLLLNESMSKYEIADFNNNSTRSTTPRAEKIRLAEALKAAEADLEKNRILLAKAHRGSLIAVDKPVYTRSFHISQSNELRRVLNQDGIVFLRATVSRDQQQINNAVRSLRKTSKTGLAAVAVGAGIIAHEVVTANAEEKVSAQQAPILDRKSARSAGGVN